jgi:flagellar biosynthesis protein FliQ
MCGLIINIFVIITSIETYFSIPKYLTVASVDKIMMTWIERKQQMKELYII